MFMGRVWVALCALRRVDSSLPQTYGGQAVQVSPLRPLLQPFRSLGAPYEAARLNGPTSLPHHCQLPLVLTVHRRNFLVCVRAYECRRTRRRDGMAEPVENVSRRPKRRPSNASSSVPIGRSYSFNTFA